MFPSTLLLGLAVLTLGHAAPPSLQASCSVHPAKSYLRDLVQNTQTQLDSGVYKIFSAATRGQLQSSSEYPDELRVFVPNSEYTGNPGKFGLTSILNGCNCTQDQVAVGRSYPQSFIISPENDNFIIGTYNDNKLWSVTGASISLVKAIPALWVTPAEQWVFQKVEADTIEEQF
ncbi:hypothetical protein C8J57DRAFT_1224058 [Mycena rebaudengoi]|nr:hypothetical protein C8J57DRAFT_1224058 [Mycena rebaudengoi]